jgi:hypothetical protein
VTLVAVVGDGCTTTALGLAASWRSHQPCALVELDAAGGSLAAWLDVPRSPGLADVVAASSQPTWDDVERAMRHSSSGPRVLVAPAGAIEAAAVVQAAVRSVIPVLVAADQVVVADGGRLRGAISPLAAAAAVVVIAHRQHSGSAAAAALGLERVAELVGQFASRSIDTVVALIGQRPYATAEVAEFVRSEVVPLAVDPWAASILAGRAASAARLGRSALMRSLADLADVVAARIDSTQPPAPVAPLVEEQV